ncbi:MAG TPA: PilZ domain-containing protein [Bryobacteraceae bacterium]|nr:PilZ domain-containing protein [Bryobacteraceae bacterium]
MRRGVRYDVRLQCQVFSPTRVFEELTGVTQNMSRSGLLLALEQTESTARLPEVGQAARIVLELPRSAPERRCVECLGRVVRVDRDLPSVAFEFRRYQFTGNGAPAGPAGQAFLS